MPETLLTIPGGSIPNRKTLVYAVLAGACAAAFALLVWEGGRRGFAWGKVWDLFSGLELPWLALASAIAISTYIGRALRWRVLLRPLRPHPDMRALISATMIGFAAVTVLGRPGEFVRPYLIASKEKLAFSSQLASWVVERIYDLLAALLIFGFALSQVHNESDTMNPGPAISWILRVGGWATLLLCLACLGVLLAIRGFSDASREKLLARMHFLSEHHLGRLERLVTALLQGAASTRSAWATAQILFWSMLEWVLIAACYYAIVRAFGDGLPKPFNWLDVTILMGFVSFDSLVQIPGVGGGVQVAAVLVLTEIFGLPLETATSMAVLIWLITFVLIVPVGAGLALRQGITWATVKAARREIST